MTSQCAGKREGQCLWCWESQLPHNVAGGMLCPGSETTCVICVSSHPLCYCMHVVSVARRLETTCCTQTTRKYKQAVAHHQRCALVPAASQTCLPQMNRLSMSTPRQPTVFNDTARAARCNRETLLQASRCMQMFLFASPLRTGSDCLQPTCPHDSSV